MGKPKNIKIILHTENIDFSHLQEINKKFYRESAIQLLNKSSLSIDDKRKLLSEITNSLSS